jgi:hypothetical protein
MSDHDDQASPELTGFDPPSPDPFDGDPFADEADSPAENVLDDWIVYPAMALGILVTTFLPILLGQRICLPLLSAAVLIPMFLWALRQGRPGKAIALALFWAALQSLSVILASLLFPDSAAQAVQGGLEYRSAWLQWIADGSRTTLPPALDYGRQLVDLVIYTLAMALTGGVGGLLLLTLALDRFNFTVASLLAAAQNPVLAALAGWPLWMIVRLVGAIVVGAVLAEPVASLDLRPAFLLDWLHARWRLLLAGLALILLGFILQILLSPLYRAVLQRALE